MGYMNPATKIIRIPRPIKAPAFVPVKEPVKVPEKEPVKV